MLFHAAIGVIMLIVCWKWGDWRHWKSYYPTILYFIIGDLTAYILLHENPLWLYHGFLNKSPFFLDLYYAVLVYPSMIILYLSHYPDRIKKQIAYIVLWVSGFSFFEYALSLLGLFSYNNGWHIGCSILFNVIMFPLLRLHYKKPLLVWPISMALAFTVMLLFKIPFSTAYIEGGQ